MKLEKAIGEVLANRDIDDFYALLDSIKKKSKSKASDEAIEDAVEDYLMNHGITDITINHDANKVVYREQLFQNTSFRVQLTPQEMTEKKLIIGHRFLPFIHPSVHPEKIFLIDQDDNEITIHTETYDFMEVGTYFMFMPPYGLTHYDMDDNGKILLFAYDIRDWMTRNNFKEKDNILISPIDYSKNIFRLEKMSSRDIATQRIVTKQKDDEILALLEELMYMETMMLPIDLQLFQIFAYCKEHTVAMPGSPLGPFLSSNEDIGIFNNGSYAYLNMNDNIEDFFDMALNDAMFIDPENMGKATDLDGIFAEMGNSFSEEFIQGKLIAQVHEKQETNIDEIVSILFRKDMNPFFNEQQEKNFHKALKKLAKKIEKEWSSKRLSLPLQRLLQKTILFKIEIIGLLRAIDDQLEDPEDFDFSMLMPLQTFEGITDQFLFLVIGGEDSNPSEINGLLEQLDHMLVEFHKARDFILEQL